MYSAVPLPRILLIDDSPVDLRLMVEFLRGRGFVVLIAQDGEQGLARARDQAPDLILLDVRMPGMDGFTICRRLKDEELTRHVPVIFLTGADEVGERLAGFEAGAVDYIVKPFFEEEVVARIRVHLQRGRPAVAVVPTPAPEPAPPEAVSREREWVRQACALLDERLGDPPSVFDLARIVGTNERRLSELFREQVGTTVFGYVREQRLLLAARLLVQTSVPVQDMAEQVGYSTSSNFITAFRARFGCSPRRYRTANAPGRAA
jgi:DNA-binding response OmpR family regulator